MPNLTKKISSVLTADVFAFGLSIVAGIVLARGLEPSDRGIFGLCFSAAMLFSAIFTGGLNSAVTYFIAKKNETTRQAIGASILWIAASSLCLVGFLFFSADFLGRNILKGLSSHFIILIAIMTSILIANNLITAIFLGQGHYFYRNTIQILRQVLRVGLISIVLFVFMGHAFEAMLANIASLATATLLAWWLTLRKSGVSFVFKNHFLRDISFYSINIYPAAVAGLAFGHVSIFCLNALDVPLDLVGQYTVAVSTLLPVILFIPNAVSNVIFPEFTRITSEQRYNLAPQACRCTLIVTAATSLILGFSAKPLIILLFGAEYAVSAMIFIWLLPGVVMRTFGNISAQILNSSGYPHYTSFISVSTLAVVVILNLVLIPLYGVKGAAGAYSLAYVYNAIVAIFLCRRAKVLKVSQLVLFRQGDFRLIFRAVVKSLSRFKVKR